VGAVGAGSVAARLRVRGDQQRDLRVLLQDAVLLVDFGCGARVVPDRAELVVLQDALEVFGGPGGPMFTNS